METLIFAILFGLIVVIFVLVIVLTVGLPGKSEGVQRQAAVSDSLRALVASQRQDGGLSGTHSKKKNLAVAAASEDESSRKKERGGFKMTVEKKIRYARWKITPVQFRAVQIMLTLLMFVPAYLYGNLTIKCLELFLVPMLVRGVLDNAVGKRFKAFDADYPVFLLQYVSLLKTGLNTIAGLDAAAKGLDPGSLCRAEIELLIERLRLGLSEEQAINAFGEDIAHPEIELFVQSLLLSRRVGGNLSNTLERLARQVRKRQQFREQAVAAIGMERGSMYAVAVIMAGLFIYMVTTQPVLVSGAFTHPTGNTVFQTGVALILFGFWWSRVVTNIRV